MNWQISAVLVNIALALINFSSAAIDWCTIPSCPIGLQTVCVYKSSEPSSRCGGYQGSGLTQQQKRNILNLHNQLRQKVAIGNENRGSNGRQPAAKYMPNLQWDNELEFVAQRWAQQCSYGHDACRNVPRYYVGQNIAESGTTKSVNTIDVLDMVNDWYNEVTKFNRNEIAHFTGDNGGPQIGHYTQIVWAKTTKIGCGAVRYRKGSYNTLYLVCNYGPGGNILGAPVYEAR